jgi:hypothetical protein
MLTSHSAMLSTDGPYQSTVDNVPGGVRWRVIARDTADVSAVTRIRGLGFAGLLTVGNHHAPHHLAIARGESNPHGH